LTAGPATVAAELNSNPDIAPVITLLDQRGSRVILGQLQVIPVGEGLVWVQPLFVRPDEAGSRQVFVRRVLAWYDGKSVIGDTLSEAINRLFPGANVNLGEIVLDDSIPTPDNGANPDTDSSVDPGDVVDPDTETPGAPGNDGGIVSNDPASLLSAAETLFEEADLALRGGDLGTYQSKVQEAQELISRALILLNS
jgi:uncharacterized membrane protein (UPF0182 family)